MGTEQKSAVVVANLEADQLTRSILEVSESLRANIYSLLSRLGYLDHPGLKIDDHITLTIIESYLEFKVCSLIFLKLELNIYFIIDGRGLDGNSERINE